MVIDKKILGQRIKNIRINRKETMEQFAQELDSGKSNVSKWERGNNIPNDITLAKIADLGNTTVELLTRPNTHERVKQLVEKLERDVRVDSRYKPLYYPGFKYSLIDEMTEIINGNFPIGEEYKYEGLNFDADNVVSEIIRNKIYDKDRTSRYLPFTSESSIEFATKELAFFSYDLTRILKENNANITLINDIEMQLTEARYNIEKLEDKYKYEGD